ncbi:MAG: SDR family NAD(P)-dependent oxidoreductase [Chloroflexota bacterium]|nr:SDR family NAD(P)-dependent oxidoreductase [Chloroflexota bacterium]
MLINPTLKSEVLQDQVAIVTGGSRGIGGAAAEMLAANGAHVVIADVDKQETEEAASRICNEYGADRVSTFVADLIGVDACDQLVEKVLNDHGRIDTVVNSAGYAWDGGIHSMSDDQFQAMLDIHAIVPFRIARASAPYFRQAALDDNEAGIERHRKTIMISSMAAQWGLVGAGNYATGKAAMLGLMRTLAQEWGKHRVNVNAVAFGGVQTRFGLPQSEHEVVESGGHKIHVGVAHKRAEALGLKIDRDAPPTNEEIYSPRANKNTLFGRNGTIREAADAIFWLASPLSDFVTGQVIAVSGGAQGGMS